jgi:cation transport ATPase
MFQLESAIQNWRNSLQQDQTMLPEDIDELETHLRDQIDSLTLSRLNPDEAFWVASHRFGDNSAVAREFAKVNTAAIWKHRAFWMIFGIFISMLITSLAAVLSKTGAIVLKWIQIDSNISGLAASLGYISAVLIAFVILFTCFDGLSQWFRRRCKMHMILILGVIGLFFLKIITLGLDVLYFRWVPAEEIGQTLLVSRYVMFGWNVLWPILLVIMLLCFMPAKSQKT